MQEQSKTDAEDDRTRFAKFSCHVRTTLEEANAAIKESTDIISRETGLVDQLRGANGKLSVEIAKLTKQLQQNADDQEAATTQREKENDAFVEMKEDSEGAISQLGEAIKILAEIGADQTAESRDTADRDRFLKLDKKSASLVTMSRLQSSMRDVAELLPEDKRAKVTSFMQAPFSGTYTSQSGEIIGILKNMKDTFESDLAKATALEKKRLDAFNKLIALLQEDAETYRNTRKTKEGQLADNATQIKDKRKTISENETIKADNEELVQTTTEESNEKTRQYEGRRATRAQEDASISKAISILNSDAAFANSNFQSFIQIQADEPKKKNPFKEVLGQITKMIKAIDDEQKADKKKKDWCESENEKNEKNQTEAENTRDAEDAKATEAQADLTQNQEDLATTQQEIKDLQNDRASFIEDQIQSNQAYQKSIAELNDAHDVLKRAVKALTDFYEAESTANSKEDHEYESQGGADVIALLQDIQKQTQDSETSAHEFEEQSQTAFEELLTETDKTIADKEAQSVELRAAIADAEERLLNAKTEHGRQVKIIETIKAYKASIKPGCDFILTHFETRTSNREQEKNQLEFGLQKVNDLVSGGKTII